TSVKDSDIFKALVMAGNQVQTAGSAWDAIAGGQTPAVMAKVGGVFGGERIGTWNLQSVPAAQSSSPPVLSWDTDAPSFVLTNAPDFGTNDFQVVVFD